MEIGKEYTSRTGTKRTPLYYSDDKRFVFVNCQYADGTTMEKWFWANHHLFEEKRQLHKK